MTDSLTDLDVFKDLQEACSQRKVPVYVLLDQACAPAFLKMCRNVGVRLDDLQVCGWRGEAEFGPVGTTWKWDVTLRHIEICPQSFQQMRVRTITGTTYYTRSGARITGKVHERFMLIDGNRVATGSYRYQFTERFTHQAVGEAFILQGLVFSVMRHANWTASTWLQPSFCLLNLENILKEFSYHHKNNPAYTGNTKIQSTLEKPANSICIYGKWSASTLNQFTHFDKF